MKKLWGLHLNEEPNGRVSFLLEAFFKDSVRKHRLSIEGADLKGGVFNGRGLELLAIASEGSQSQRQRHTRVAKHATAGEVICLLDHRQVENHRVIFRLPKGIGSYFESPCHWSVAGFADK